MDKKAIKNFAIEARKNLMNEIKYQASILGITSEGITEPIKKAEGIEIYDIGGATPYTIYDETIKQKNSLIKRINEKGFENVIEEIAYTWFNRIIAIRYMEVNDYLPTRVRVLSSTNKGKIEPDIITEALNIDLNFSDEEIEQIYQLKNENKLDKLFKILFIKQCNILNEILPELFEETSDYTELLLPISFTNEDGIVRQLIDSISEEDFTDQVEIIGWLYQYYITELNALVYDGSFKRAKITKELLPAATQLFTPDWPVKYMVENSLGRYWLESHPNDDIKNNLKYYIDNNSELVKNLKEMDIKPEIITPESITVFDPCMGSGHFLSYVFDLLMDIYKSSGYNESDAAILILEKNIYGVDIDDRAYQLAYFSLLMKARYYNRKILQNDIKINLCSIKESNIINIESLYNIKDNTDVKKDLEYIISIFTDAKEYGSILNVDSVNFERLYDYLDQIESKSSETLYGVVYTKNSVNLLYSLIKQAELLSKEYDVVVTNPPYLNSSRFSVKLSNYVKENYKNTKTDLAAILYQKAIQSFCKDNGYLSFITITSWMFLKNFEKFREKVILNIQFESLVDFGTELFEGKIGHNPIVAWVNKNTLPFKNLTAIRLSEFNYSRRNEKESEFFNGINKFKIDQKDFALIRGSPVAYWATDKLIKTFINGKELSTVADAKQGLATGDNNRFLRLWYEVDMNKCGFGYEDALTAEESHIKWFPYNKGGDFRKWYGNQDYLVNWENDGYEIRNIYDSKGKLRSRPQNTQYYFNKSLSWSKVSSGDIAFRYFPNGFLFDVAGCSIFSKDENDMFYLLGFLNSKVCGVILGLISPTLNYEVGHIASLPIINSEEYLGKVTKLVQQNIKIGQQNWDSFETSWNFKSHPLIKYNMNNIEIQFNEWKSFNESEFFKIKSNEVELNNIFIDIYGLKGELNSNINDKSINLTSLSQENEIKSLISYSMGCMFGRYSLDNNGIIFSGGQWNPSEYTRFTPDEDNIIPIADIEYFEDDIVGRFVEFIKVAYGKETLEENLDFIAKALKNKRDTSRETIRNYFLTDFYKDHLKTYQKRPIYWLFDSGKNNGFKAFIYMHRYESDLVARVRTDYLHKTQKALETAISSNERILENSTSASEKAKAVKAKNILIKQLEETRKYDSALSHVANQRISIDLDDGVKVNYEKFQGVKISSEGKKDIKIDLLKKI